MKSLSDKVAIVTGSSMGIGKSIARNLAQQKVKVVLNARNEEKLRVVEKEFREEGYDVIAIRADVSSIDDCERLIQSTISRYGKLDILINNAGVSMRGNVEDLSPHVIQQVFNTNAVGPFVLTQKAMVHLKKTKGSVIFISSLAGLKGLPNLSAYCASKMALTAITESLRIEHAKSDLHVGIVYAGYTEIENGKTTLGADGNLIMLEQRSDGRQHSIEYVARRTIQLIVNRENRTFIGITGRVYYFLLKHFPYLMERLIRNQFRKMTNVYK